MKKITVIVVDDSALIRKLLAQIINSQPDMVTVGAAPDPLKSPSASGRRRRCKKHKRFCRPH